MNSRPLTPLLAPTLWNPSHDRESSPLAVACTVGGAIAGLMRSGPASRCVFARRPVAEHGAKERQNPHRQNFFSPAERRHRYADKTPATDAPSAGTARAERLEINGAISSSTQGRAVWVNGTAIENSARFKSAWTDRAGSVWLRDDRRAPRLVRPGQAIDPASGAIQDLLPAGSVARR